MAEFCGNCGNALRANARFCAKCGSPIIATSTAQQPVHTASKNTNTEHTVKNTKKRRCALCVVLAITLLLQTSAVSMYGWPGFALDKNAGSALQADKSSEEGSKGYSNIKITDKDYKAKPVILNVGPENTVAKVGGITVDFGEFNLSEEGSLEIRDIGMKRDDKKGYNAHCYDFSLEDVEEFPMHVTITLPYEKVQNASARLFVQYYDESTSTWELIYSVLNESEGTITFYTDHFSTFGVFDLFLYEKGYNSGPLAKVHFNPLKLDDLINNCKADSESFFAMLRKNSPEDRGLVKVALDSFGLTSNLLSGVDYPMNLATTVSETLTNSAEWPFTKELGKLLGKVGAGLTAVKVGLSWYKSGKVTDAFKEHKYDLAELGLSTAAGALGTASLTVAAGGIWLMSMVDEGITDIYNKGYESPIEHAYQVFTWDYVSYSNSARQFGCILPNNMPARALLDDEMTDAVIVNKGNTWAWLLQREFVKHRNNPQKVFEAIDKLLDDYASTFWNLKPGVRKMIAEDIHRSDSWIEPNAQEKTKLKENLKAILRYRLRKLFACIYERCILDAKQRLLWDIKDLQAKMNTETGFSVYAIDDNEKDIPLSETEYKDYVAAFAISPSNKPTIWNWSPGSKGNAEFKCTLFNYLAIGAPSYVKLYETWEKQVEDKAAFTLPFTYSAPEVKLKIADEGLSDDKIIGFTVDEITGRLLQEDFDKIIDNAFASAGSFNVSCDEKGNASFTISGFDKTEDSSAGSLTWRYDISCGSMTFTGTFDPHTGTGEFTSPGTNITVGFYRHNDNNSSTTNYTVTNAKATLVANDYSVSSNNHHLSYSVEGTDGNGKEKSCSGSVDLIPMY